MISDQGETSDDEVGALRRQLAEAQRDLAEAQQYFDEQLLLGAGELHRCAEASAALQDELVRTKRVLSRLRREVRDLRAAHVVETERGAAADAGGRVARVRAGFNWVIHALGRAR